MAASAGEAVSLPISVTEGNNPDLFSGKPRIDPRSKSPAGSGLVRNGHPLCVGMGGQSPIPLHRETV